VNKMKITAHNRHLLSVAGQYILTGMWLFIIFVKSDSEVNLNRHRKAAAVTLPASIKRHDNNGTNRHKE